jgi:hypothetical protein
VTDITYLASAFAGAVGATVLIILLVWLARAARILSATARNARAHLRERWNALAAKIAALRVEVNRRRRHDGTARSRHPV